MGQTVFLLLIASFCAYLAYNRGRSPLIWFFLTYITGGLAFIFFVFFFLDEDKVQKGPFQKREDQEDSSDTIEVEVEEISNMGDERIWWYLDRENQKHGPLAKKEVEDLLDQRIVNSETFLWKEGMKDWEKLKKVFN